MIQNIKFILFIYFIVPSLISCETRDRTDTGLRGEKTS